MSMLNAPPQQHILEFAQHVHHALTEVEPTDSRIGQQLPASSTLPGTASFVLSNLAPPHGRHQSPIGCTGWRRRGCHAHKHILVRHKRPSMPSVSAGRSSLAQGSARSADHHRQFPVPPAGCFDMGGVRPTKREGSFRGWYAPLHRGQAPCHERQTHVATSGGS